MGSLEEYFLKSEDNRPRSVSYMDLWPWLHHFLEHLNSHYHFQLAWTISPSPVIFLDVDIHTTSKVSAPQSIPNLPNNSNIYTPPAINPHPSNATYNFSKLSVVEASTAILMTYLFHLHPTSAFASHGYLLLQHQISHTPPSFQLRTKSIPSSALITAYHPGLQILKNILRESHHIFLSDPSTCHLLTYLPTITFHHPSSTRQNQLWSRTPDFPHQPIPVPILSRNSIGKPVPYIPTACPSLLQSPHLFHLHPWYLLFKQAHISSLALRMMPSMWERFEIVSPLQWLHEKSQQFASSGCNLQEISPFPF